jgi:voltage-dependent calcium channel L type alpha-1D
LYAYNIKVSDSEDQCVSALSNEGVYPRLNFNDMSDSLITVFALLVNEDWNYVLYTYVNCGESTWIGYVFIGFVVILGNFILLQLFLAILIDNFASASE